MLAYGAVENEDTRQIDERLQGIESMLKRLVETLDRFAPVLDRLARNPLFGGRR